MATSVVMHWAAGVIVDDDDDDAAVLPLALSNTYNGIDHVQVGVTIEFYFVFA